MCIIISFEAHCTCSHLPATHLCSSRSGRHCSSSSAGASEAEAQRAASISVQARQSLHSIDLACSVRVVPQGACTQPAVMPAVASITQAALHHVVVPLANGIWHVTVGKSRWVPVSPGSLCQLRHRSALAVPPAGQVRRTWADHSGTGASFKSWGTRAYTCSSVAPACAAALYELQVRVTERCCRAAEPGFANWAAHEGTVRTEPAVAAGTGVGGGS
jgi:hypothetical protein